MTAAEKRSIRVTSLRSLLSCESCARQPLVLFSYGSLHLPRVCENCHKRDSARLVARFAALLKAVRKGDADFLSPMRCANARQLDFLPRLWSKCFRTGAGIGQSTSA